MKMRPPVLKAVVFIFFLLANPAYFLACEEEETFSFGEDEMLALIPPLNESSWQIDGYEITVTLSQRGESVARRTQPAPELTAVAQACGDRTFVASAAACEDISSLPVTGTATVYRINEDDTVTEIETLAVDGHIEVLGRDLVYATAYLYFGDRGSAAVTWGESSGDTFSMRWIHTTGLGDGSVTIDYESPN